MGNFLAVKRTYFLEFERRADGFREGTADIIRLILGCAIAPCRGNLSSDAIAIMITGTTSGLMRSRHIRRESNEYVSGWNGIGQGWAREFWEPS